jgi:c-di-GMP-binding flagellar brake protein YcgR
MGTPISRIEKEFILNAIFEKGMAIGIHGDKKEGSGKVLALDNDVLTIGVPGGGDFSQFHQGEEVRIFFTYYEQVMTFISTIEEINDNELVLTIPDAVYKNLQRKYERIPSPGGAVISFVIEEERVQLDFPKSEEYDPVEIPQASITFNSDELADLIDAFRNSVNSFCTANEIKMFREQKPETFEEKLVARTGRILYLPSVLKGLPEDSMGLGIVTRGSFFDDEFELTQDKLPEYLKDRQALGIQSEVFCPVLYHEYTVGYIRLVSTNPSLLITVDHVRKVKEFSKILSYSLKLNGYFEEEVSPEEYNPTIIDLSASGMLFGHPSEKLNDLVMLYTDLSVQMRIGDRSMTIESRIMRKFEGPKMTYYGLQFLDIQPEDFRFLFDFIYGRQFTLEDADLWEGGATPPKLEL